jgi:hypothetical protein
LDAFLSVRALYERIERIRGFSHVFIFENRRVFVEKESLEFGWPPPFAPAPRASTDAVWALTSKHGIHQLTRARGKLTAGGPPGRARHGFGGRPAIPAGESRLWIRRRRPAGFRAGNAGTPS